MNKGSKLYDLITILIKSASLIFVLSYSECFIHSVSQSWQLYSKVDVYSCFTVILAKDPA